VIYRSCNGSNIDITTQIRKADVLDNTIAHYKVDACIRKEFGFEINVKIVNWSINKDRGPISSSIELYMQRYKSYSIL
jgi:hypothetical protein